MKPPRPSLALIVMCQLFPALSLAQHEHPPSTSPAGEGGPQPMAIFIWPEPARLDGALQTDRPGFSDTAFLVPRGHVQLELGYLYSHDSEDDTDTKSQLAATTSLRVGLLDDLELRVKWGGYSMVDSKFPDVSPGGRHYENHQHDDGATDMSVGFKAPILKHTESNLLPNLSMVPALSLPTRTDNKTSGDVDPSFELAWNYPLTDKFTLYGIGSIAAISDGGGRYAQEAFSFAGCYSITDRLSWFVEYFGIYPNTRNSDGQNNIDMGPVFLVTDNIQLDVEVGIGLNEEAPDFFINGGVAIRF